MALTSSARVAGRLDAVEVRIEVHGPTRSRKTGNALVGVDVVGSRAFGDRLLTGIGASRVSSHVNLVMCDAVETVTGWDSVLQCRR